MKEKWPIKINKNSYRNMLVSLICGISAFGYSQLGHAQDIEPRRWTVLPDGMQVLGLGYANIQGDLFFDPVLDVTDAEVKMEAYILGYVKSFSAFDRPVRIDVNIPWQKAHWDGLVKGEMAVRETSGFGDPRIRFSMNLYGDEVMNVEQFKASIMKPTTDAKTSVGASIAVSLPWGEYEEDKLLNISHNRYYVRPQIGVVHTRGKVSYELTSSVFLYGDNDEFLIESTVSQDPLYTSQAHIIYVYRPGVWGALSAGYAYGGEKQVNNVDKDDKVENVLLGASVGFPISRQQGIKLGYIRSETRTNKGSDLNTLMLAWSYLF